MTVNTEEHDIVNAAARDTKVDMLTRKLRYIKDWVMRVHAMIDGRGQIDYFFFFFFFFFQGDLNTKQKKNCPKTTIIIELGA